MHQWQCKSTFTFAYQNIFWAVDCEIGPWNLDMHSWHFLGRQFKFTIYVCYDFENSMSSTYILDRGTSNTRLHTSEEFELKFPKSSRAGHFNFQAEISRAGFLTARRRGSKKTFDGLLLGHYEKCCQNGYEQFLNLFHSRMAAAAARLPPLQPVLDLTIIL